MQKSLFHPLTLFIPGYFEVKEYRGVAIAAPPSNFKKNCRMMVVKGSDKIILVWKISTYREFWAKYI